ncbi:uncharacterized protein MYCFIDRAFT_211717 [Pseudocercospora fijiensis CIRAD86]|uniref:Uncharacterized protein n=1 Tax=Pseudocercospora fijiensis (strain CIRAD86) TaxID=383855 RepID=M2ZPE5_PSEFD|nr:uncharacterized protein MYCFIDRAFT_211717 [Pseudocercospora fijiensis CIRAD86]EME80969.1 hypothetical protein MYCFIDRAFT_211717 [Pseudocercospora fijiensis CIRAD86]
MTTLPTGVSTDIIHPTGITTNTWITTTKDSSTTIVPVIWCTSCAPNGGDGLVVIWDFPPVSGVDFNWGSIFPGLPTFNLPCIRIFGIQVAGDCANPDSEKDDNNDDNDDDNQSSKTGSETSTTSTSTSTQSCTQSTTASDCRVGCSVSYTSTASSLSSTTVCYTTSCYQTVGCSLRPSTSSTISTPSSTASACALIATANDYDAWATYSSLGLAIPAWMDGATVPLPTDIDSDDDTGATTTGENSNATISTSLANSTTAPVTTTQAANSPSSIASTSITSTQSSTSTITSTPSSTTGLYGCNYYLDFSNSMTKTSCLCGSIQVAPETVTSSGTAYLQCSASGVALSTVYTITTMTTASSDEAMPTLTGTAQETTPSGSTCASTATSTVCNGSGGREACVTTSSCASWEATATTSTSTSTTSEAPAPTKTPVLCETWAECPECTEEGSTRICIGANGQAMHCGCTG